MPLFSSRKEQDLEGKHEEGWEEERSAYKAGKEWMSTSLACCSFSERLYTLVPKEQYVFSQKKDENIN